jgi:hypothetical protein
MKQSIKLAACGAALALLATACGGDADSADPGTTTSSGMSSSGSMSESATANPSATDAATLRANLTGLLHDHVWLAGNALQTAVLQKGNLKDKQVTGAVAALDDNSMELSKAIGAAYPDAEKPFLASWRQHIGFFVDYTLGKATKDDAKVMKAKMDLDGYRTSFGQLINSVVPELPADAVAEELVPHVDSLLTAIDAAVANDPRFQSELAHSADHMMMTAGVLADGIAKNKGLEGDANGTASTTRATLTGQLNDHVWLAGNALQTAVRQGGDLKDKQVAGAVKALDDNSVVLSKTIGSVYPDAEKPFLASWRQHIGFFVDYTLGKATKDDAKVDKAKMDLGGYRTSFGQLINSVVPELPAEAVAEELVPHVDSLFTAIDAAVANDPTFQQKLDESAHHMTMTAAILTGGIVANKKITD